MATEFVQVRNPANGNVGSMPKVAFERTFKDKGFELVSDDKPEEVAETPNYLGESDAAGEVVDEDE